LREKEEEGVKKNNSILGKEGISCSLFNSLSFTPKTLKLEIESKRKR